MVSYERRNKRFILDNWYSFINDGLFDNCINFNLIFMGYNPYRWWTKGKRNKPLPEHYPLAQKIQNGDYNYSYMFAEAKEMKDTAHKVYQETYDNYGGTDQKNRIEVALEASRMKRLKALKLELEAAKDEEKILWKLRKDLQKTFGLDLWEEALEKVDGDLMDLYTYYKMYERD